MKWREVHYVPLSREEDADGDVQQLDASSASRSRWESWETIARGTSQSGHSTDLDRSLNELLIDEDPTLCSQLKAEIHREIF